MGGVDEPGVNAKQVGLVLGGVGAAAFLAFAPAPERSPAVDCDRVIQEGETFAEDHGGTFPEAAFRDMCASATWHVVPESTPAPMPPSPGCESFEHPKPLPRRTVAAPAKPIPYFARTTGELPADGAAVVGGVEVPHGSRCAGYWATDNAVEAPYVLAGRLAAQFPRTGLWPILWATEGEPPDHYLRRVTDPAASDRVDVLAALSTDSDEVKRLAPGSRAVARTNADPFVGVPAPASTVVMLVPVNRPAEVLSLLGGLIDTEYYTDTQLTAVARSWEERFGAVPVIAEAGGLVMHVQAPPRDVGDAQVLAHELRAFAPDEPYALGTLTSMITQGDPWTFGWPD
jgi:hypothetical protein